MSSVSFGGFVEEFVESAISEVLRV